MIDDETLSESEMRRYFGHLVCRPFLHRHKCHIVSGEWLGVHPHQGHCASRHQA
jgi:hypothetical protein